MSDESEETEQTYRSVIEAGMIHVSHQAGSGEESREGLTEIWKQVLEDINEMPEEDRNEIGLQ